MKVTEQFQDELQAKNEAINYLTAEVEQNKRQAREILEKLKNQPLI